MRVVIVSTNDINGGAARAAYRLHRSLISAGINSTMLVLFKSSTDPTVIALDKSHRRWVSRLRRFCEKLLSTVTPPYDQAFNSLAWLSNRPAVAAINALSADVVHLHWCNSGFLSASDLPRIKGKVVWTLHDMWAFTSGKHVDPRFDPKCMSKCPVGITLIERIILSRKARIYDRIDSWTIIGISNWMTHAAKKSSLLRNFTHKNLPNPIETDVFRNAGLAESRTDLGIGTSETVILFGAMNADTDTNKGLDFLLQALNLLPPSYRVIFFGTNPNITDFNLRQHLYLFGTVGSDKELIRLYSAADVMVVPSRCENLSNTIMEAQSCSLPVVAFDVGGNSDLVQHHTNGYLASPEDARDLAKGIKWAADPTNNKRARKAARQNVLRNFDANIVAKRYIKLYRSLPDPHCER